MSVHGLVAPCLIFAIILIPEPSQNHHRGAVRLISEKYAALCCSGGGITVSGGEPWLQAEFVAALFHACRKQEIRTKWIPLAIVREKRTLRLSYKDAVLLFKVWMPRTPLLTVTIISYLENFRYLDRAYR